MPSDFLNTHSLMPYIKRFSITYAVGILAVMVITIFLDLSGGANMGVLVASIFLSAMKFAQDNQRIPEKKERFIISVYCLFSAILISIALSIIPWALSGFNAPYNLPEGLSIGLLLISAGIIVLLYFAIIYFTYNWAVKIQLKKMQK